MDGLIYEVCSGDINGKLNQYSAFLHLIVHNGMIQDSTVINSLGWLLEPFIL